MSAGAMSHIASIDSLFSRIQLTPSDNRDRGTMHHACVHVEGNIPKTRSEIENELTSIKQGSHFSGLTKFPDFSSIFGQFSSIFLMFYFFN